MKSGPKGLDLTTLVLLAVLAVAYFKGLDAAAWTLVWVWAGMMALLALLVGVLATFQSDRTEIRFGFATNGVFGQLFLALWALFTAVGFADLALHGHPLFWFPVLSLAVVVLPGTGRLILDEFVQSLLAKGAALAGGMALAAGPLLALSGAPGLDVALAALALYAMGLEVYVWRRLT